MLILETDFSSYALALLQRMYKILARKKEQIEIFRSKNSTSISILGTYI